MPKEELVALKVYLHSLTSKSYLLSTDNNQTTAFWVGRRHLSGDIVEQDNLNDGMQIMLTMPKSVAIKAMLV